MKRLLTLALLLAVPSAYAFDSVLDIMKHFSAQRVEALVKYLEENPDAEDKARAYDALIDGYVIQKNYKNATQLLEKKYSLALQSHSFDMQTLFGEIVPTHAVLSLQGGLKKEGQAFLERVLNDFNKHEAIIQIEEVLAEWQSEFNLPGIGESMDIRFKPTNAKKEVSLEALKGKVVLVDFWATWCPLCVQAMPELKSVYTKYHDKGFEILGISADQSKRAFKTFIKKEKLSWPQVFDAELEESIADAIGIFRYPTTFLIGKDGKIIATDLGDGELEKQLEKLL